MSIVRAERADTPASRLPSPAVAVPLPRRSEPAAALPGNPSSAARTASAAAPSCSGGAARSAPAGAPAPGRSGHAARPGSVGSSAAPGPARPATPSRQHVRAVLTGSPRSPRFAPRLRIVRPGDQPAAYRSPATTRPGIAQPSQAPVRPNAARPGIARTSAARPSAIAPRSMQAGSQLTAVRPHPAPPGGLRLTRRGRLVLSVFALALIVGLIAILWASLAGGAQAASGRARTGSVYQGMRRVTVLPGQTLWAIARRAEPSADPRTVIPQIMQINAISSTNLQPGQQLWVPRS
jgi:hypothetical protein